MADVYGEGVTPPRPVDGLEVHLVDDGFVVHDLAAGRVHHLNLTSALVFDLCDGEREVDDIADEVAAAFSLDDPPLAETRECIDQLVAEQVLVVDGDAQTSHQSADDS